MFNLAAPSGSKRDRKLAFVVRLGLEGPAIGLIWDVQSTWATGNMFEIMLVEGFRVDLDYFRKRVFGSCWLSETDMSHHYKSSWTVKSVDEMIHTMLFWVPIWYIGLSLPIIFIPIRDFCRWVSTLLAATSGSDVLRHHCCCKKLVGSRSWKASLGAYSPFCVACKARSLHYAGRIFPSKLGPIVFRAWLV